MDNNINYYRELFRAFYNKRFKNVAEVKQLAESLGYKAYCDTYCQIDITKRCVNVKQTSNKDYLYFKKDDFILENGYYGFPSNLCNKNQISKNIVRKLYKALDKEYPKLDNRYLIPETRQYDIKKFNYDWKVILKNMANLLEAKEEE